MKSMKKTLLPLALASVLSASVLAAPKANLAASDVQAQSASSTSVANNLPAKNNLLGKQPEIAATAYLVKDLQSNQIIAGKNVDNQIEPASLTKLMTAYLTFKALEEGKLKPDQMIKVSDKAWKAEGSRMFLDTKKSVSVSDLIKGLIVVSGNDAAITLAESIAGDESKFAQLMNDEAKRLGMNKTHFENSTGLPSKNHLTSVNDLVILSAAIIRDYPQYYPIYSIKTFAYNGITQTNRNLLLFRDPSVDGLKTGHTNSAGYNLIASSQRNGRRVVSVVVGTASNEARATESSKLLNYALQGFDTPKMYAANQEISQVKLYKGAAKSVPVGFLEDAYMTIPTGQVENIKPILETSQPLLAPIQKGQELGILKFVENGNVLAEKKVVALSDVAEAGFFGKLWDGIVLWFNDIFAD